MINPRDKWGDEFLCRPFTLKKANGDEFHCYDICVCITPQQDAASTLAYAWEVFQELAAWVCEEYKNHPMGKSYRVVIAWSKTVRKNQGHIIKIWCDLAGVHEATKCITLVDCAARFGSSWMPFQNWQKDVFA
jgi:hypothetical protein